MKINKCKNCGHELREYANSGFDHAYMKDIAQVLCVQWLCKCTNPEPSHNAVTGNLEPNEARLYTAVA